MKIFDVSLKEKIPEMEIEAKNEKDAKKIYLEAIIRALDIDKIDAIEVEITQ